ncbi:hypothetical protein TSUD_267350 [Trifolium subterraneum]|uniref:Transmembrane protein n=1 Tax=Trifolium subterraneum TaxID=3900 RepID=A0A2Z6N487_TRISU|nr:hypothetical protein TSUD_267350 [Trifolium subterraneum]
MKTKAYGISSLLKCFIIVLTLLIVNYAKESDIVHDEHANKFSDEVIYCEEFYEVREGETLITTVEKCDGQLIFIPNPNPHMEVFAESCGLTYHKTTHD